MGKDSDKDLDKKRKVWGEINKLTHIGRSKNEIEQSLYKMGYEKFMLNKILTPSVMNSLVDKEEMFLHRQQIVDNQAAERAMKEEHEALEQKQQEQHIQMQKNEEELLRQNEVRAKEAEDEIKQTYFEQQKINMGYGTNVTEQDHMRHRIEDQEIEKQEEEKRLRDINLFL